MKRMLTLLAVAAMIGFGACGKKDEQAPPPPPPQVPAPAPTNPTYPGVGGVIQGTNCPMPAGGIAPISRNGTPYHGNLLSGYGTSNSIILNAAYADNYSSNVVAGALLIYPDAAQMLPPSGSNTNAFNICTSSMVQGQNYPYAGTYNAQDFSISLSMTGTVSVPYYSPFGGYPTGGQIPMGQEVIRVSLGQTCPAYLFNGRVLGCVDIQLGSGNMPPRHYESR